MSSLSGLQVIGMTSHGALSKETHSIPYTVCKVLFFERSSFEVDVFDCHMQTSREAGKEYKCVLRGYEAPKAILMISSDFSLCPEPFIDCVNELDCNLVVFGALAGTRRMGDDKGIVYEIDDKPVFDIYRDHLGVEMIEYFFENTSSFPFMLRQNGHYLARVALEYRKEDGTLEFAVKIPVGSTVSLGYSTEQYLLEESYANAKRMFGFHPDALLIYVCMSRRMLVGDDAAEMEFDFYEHVNPNATWAHGYGEILHTNGLRGFLNASLVAVGIREGDVPEEELARTYSEIEVPLDYHIGYRPLTSRLVRFLEETTSDLRFAIDQLFNKIYNASSEWAEKRHTDARKAMMDPGITIWRPLMNVLENASGL